MASSLKILLNKLLFPVVRLYWFVFRPESSGVKCLIRCGDKILMVRNNYGRMKWTFPGGSIERRESPEDAVRREVFEETGIIVKPLKKVGSFLSTREFKRDIVYGFSTDVDNEDIKIDLSEILEAGWFYINSLPKDIGQIAKVVLEKYLNYHGNNHEKRRRIIIGII